MQRRTGVLLALVALALVASALMPLVAGAATVPNSSCLGCHGVSSLWHENFDVGAVDKNTACRKCHLDRFAGTHPYHHGGGVCTNCHTSYGPSLYANVPSGSYAYGAFASPESGDTTASILHIIHTNPRWPSNADTTNSRCASCHGVASCDACHDASVDPTHGRHGEASSTVVPWVGNMSPGVVAGNDTVNTMQYSRTVACGAPGCHDINGTANRRPIYYEDHTAPAYPADGYPYPTSIETSSAWKLPTGGLYSQKAESVSNLVNNRLLLRFTGQRVVLVGTRDPYRGIIEVFIDGVSQGVVDQYNPTTANQQVFFDSGYITSGQHSVQVRVTGNKNANARATYVGIDQFRVYTATVGKIAPDCESCHDSSHAGGGGGGGSFSHDATQTITGTNLYNTGYGNYACNQCHVTKMVDEHKRTSAAGPRSCSTCHTTYAQYSWSNTWVATDGCNFASCHPTSSPREPHAGDTADHASASVRADNACRDCHSPDLRAAHNNQYPGNGYAETKCLTCHSTTTMPAGTSCTGSGCHTVSGVTSLANHGYDATKHTPSTFTRAAQGTGADGTVADGGYECNQCHSASVLPAHSGASPAVSCDSGGAGGNGCHLDTTLNSMATAKAGWPTEKCTDCHDYGAARTHDSTSSAHLVANNGCAGTAAGCHSSNDLWQLHAVAQNGGVKKYNSCFDVDGTDPTGCHNVSDRRPTVNVANACGSTSTGCHQDINIGTHPSNYSHPFTTTSYYSAGTNTGCTNQLGCHNTGAASTADFGKVYHPTSGCSQGVCHQSASKPAFTGILPTDCQECHGGAFASAPARTNLAADPASGGHYDFTFHTASGTAMGTTVTAGGSAGATCTNCHAPTVGGTSYGLLNQHTSIVISGSPYGTSVTCGECHGDTRTYGSYEASQAINWTNNKCEDCHKAGGSSVFDHAASPVVVNGTSTASCGNTGTNCHGTYDLHALHQNAAGGCNLNGCHDYGQQAYRPAEKRCGEAGGCHATYTVNTHAHASDAAKHQPTASTQASATTFASTACGACHDIRTSSSSLTLEHALSTSAKTTQPGNVCRNCHNNGASMTAIGNNWSAKDSTGACTACHGTGGLDAVHATQNSAAHSDVTSNGCGNSGTGCHNTDDLSQVGATNVVNTNIHQDCLTCHDRTATGGNLAYDPTKDTCGSARECHNTGTQYNTTTFVHNGAGGLADGSDATHHQSLIARTNYTGDPVYDGGKECNTCHADRMSTAHANSSVGSVTCAGCHNSSVLTSSDDVVKASWPTKKCTACHGATSVHTAYQTSGGLQATHQASSSAGCLNNGAGCHGTASDFGVIHGTAGCNAGNGTSNTTCHNTDKKMNTVGKSCGNGGTCHTAYSGASHNGISTANETATHEATATGFNADITGGSFTAAGNTCVSCHSRGLGSAHKETSTTAALKWTNTAWGSTAQSICLDCHNTASPDNATAVVKTDNWSARTCDQCHATGGSNRGNGYHDRYTAAEHTATVGTPGTADGCTGTCHGSTTDVRAIHNKTTSGCSVKGTDSKGWTGGCHDIDKQMSTTYMSCGSGGSGQNCHANHTNDNHMPDHYANDATSVGCTRNGCHELADRSTDSTSVIDLHSVANAGGTVSGKPNDGCNICHGGTGGWADVAATAKTNATGFACVGCHEGVLLGTYDPYDPDHYTGTETTHNASSQTGTVSGYACTQCHKLEMKPEHITKTSSAFSTVPGTYGDKCVACHEVKVDAFAGAWNDTCDACHATKHTAMATQHDYTTGNAGCAGANCHNTADATAIHNGTPADGVTSSCASCHMNNNAVPTQRLCTDCHTAHPNEATVHTSTTIECTGCHSTKVNIATGHASCATCHADARLTDYLKNNYTPGCLDCHKAGVIVGTAPYSPVGTEHFDAPNHTSTTQGTLTYTLNGQSPTCVSCHSMQLNTEHSLGTSALTGTGTVCEKCHTNAGSTTAISGLWAGELCAACHDGTGITTAHGNVGNHTVTNAGCGNSGAGCHPTDDLGKAGADKSVNIHNDCATCHDPAGAASWTYGVAGNLKYNPVAKSCGQATGCHTAAFYSTTAHNIGQASLVDGTDATHTAAATLMDDLVGAYTNDNACSSCHSNKLKTAHATTSLASDAGCTSGGTDNKGCHNSTVLTNSPTQVKANWTNDTCADCHTTSHTTYTAATHTGNATAGCTLTSGCHGSTGGQSLDIRGIHDTAVAGCTAAGSDSKGPVTGCHALDKPMTGYAMTCGQGGACHSSHTASNHMPDHFANDATSVGCTRTGCHELADRSTDSTSVIELHDPAVTGGTVSGKTNDGCNICHGGSGWSDVAATAKANLTSFQCVGCHEGVLLGTYDPYDPDHYTGTELTHTASAAQAASTYTYGGGYPAVRCDACHKMEMKPEHITKGTSAFSSVPGTYANKCVACHEVKVDNLAGAWNDTCAACHATQHTSTATKHDATAVGASCYGSGPGSSSVDTVTGSAENFDSVGAGTWPATSWVRGGTNSGLYLTSSAAASSTPNSGAFASDVNGTARSAYFEQAFNTSSYDAGTVKLTFDYRSDFPATAGTTANTLVTSLASNTGWTCTDWTTYLDTNETTNIATSAAANDIFRVNMDNPTAVGTPTSVTFYAYAMSTVAASRDGIQFTVNGDTYLYGGTTSVARNTYTLYNSGAITQVPGTTNNWTWADINNVTAGLKHTLTGTVETMNVTQLYMVVAYDDPASGTTNYLKVQYSTNGTGGPWTDVVNTSATTPWTGVTATLPNAASVLLRFSSASDHTTRDTYVDNIKIVGTTTTAGSVCHDVTNVAAIHNNSVVQTPVDNPSNCTSSCHTSNAAVPTTTTCTDAACHGSSTHVVEHTATNSPTCLSCHTASNNTQVIHAGKGDGCNVCHGGGGFTDIHTGKTAECLQCHDGVATDESPVDGQHYVGTETSHTAQAAQSGAQLNWANNPTCGACHDMTLLSEHKAVTSAQTGGKANVCENCHLSTALPNSPTVVSTDWAARTTSSACIACHAPDTATNQHGSVAVTGNHGVTDAAQNCGSSGAGCHPVANVAQVGTPSTTANIHTACVSCHGTASRAHLSLGGGYLAAGCASNATYCHASASYASTANHATDTHTTITGDDGLHTATGMGTDFSTYVNNDLCSDCHSSGLATAHKETSTTANLNTGRTAWNSTTQSLCRDCHNAPATTNYAQSGTVIKGSWATQACSECHTRATDIHNNYTAASHTATTSGCTLSTGCHGYAGSQSIDIRTIHDKATSGCTATGTDNKGWSGGCHALDKPLTGTAMTCGDTGACHNGHTQVNHGPDHTYTVASDYTQTADTVGSEAGCTNSGVGCHGTAGGTRDAVTEYHSAVATGCTSTDACHSDPQFDATFKLGSGADCSRCHNGTAGIGRDRQPLYEAASAGHYGETTHTATAMGTSVGAGGTASALCSACHSTGLRDAHGAAGGPLTTSTKGAYVTCQECHAYTNVTPLITDATHSAECNQCHIAGVLGAAHVIHSTTAPVANVGTGTGCASTGNGCHPSADLHAIHKDYSGGCLITGCHGVNKSLTAASTSCGQATGCHTSAQYTAAQHNGTGGLANGDDATHHGATGNAGQSLGGYTTATTLCTDCHTMTLKTGHTTTSLASDPSCATGGTGNTGCHNQTTPINATPQVTSDWTAKTCEACHTTKHTTNTVAGHTVTPGTSCSLGTCHGGATDVRTLHDRAFNNAGATGQGCSAAGSDSKGTNPACHALNKAMNTVGTMSCGSTTGTQTTKCHVSHTTTNHGAGGNNCNSAGCHGSDSTERLDKMQNDITTFHHVLDDTTPFSWNTAYPNSTTALACRSCHVDHANFNGKANNLRGSYNDAPTGAFGKNTDFPGGGSYGICVSCHATALTKNATGQRVGGSTGTIAISGANYDVSAHDYLINDATKVGYDGTAAFQANCIKCHDDGATGVSSRQDGTYKLAPHLSAENRIAAALGALNTGTSTQTEENLCYKCHTGGTAGTDGYGAGTMSAKARSIQNEFARTYTHPIASSTGVHKADEGTAAGWNPSTNRHVECEDCHNVHEAKAGVIGSPTSAAPRGNTSPAIGGANAGVWGVGLNGTAWNWTGLATPNPADATFPTYTKLTTAGYQWQLCLKCHSTYAWGTTPPAVSLNLANQTGGKQTDVGEDFSPTQLAYHPLFAAGKNQPTSITWWETGNKGGPQVGRKGTNLYLTNTMVDGWTMTSIVVCTDCHNSSDATAPSGPHGSNNRWLLNGLDPNATVTFINSKGVTVTSSNSTLLGTSFTANSSNMCLNCHRTDVYGGIGIAGGAYDYLSRFGHKTFQTACIDMTLLNGAQQWSNCLHCHGGRKDVNSFGGKTSATAPVQSGALHGTSLTYHPSAATFTGTTNYMGQRFLNGSSWSQHKLDKTTTANSVGCYNFTTGGSFDAATDTYTDCTHHGGDTYSANYAY